MNRTGVCLWFDHQAEEAARFYTSIFEHSKLGKVTHYGEAGARASGQPKGSVMSVSFELDGRPFFALNGGPAFQFNEAISLVVYCKNQEEIDEYWTKLMEGGGTPGQCGWLKDRFGVSWQVVPTLLMDMHADEDPVRTERVMEAMLGMTKIDLHAIQQAYEHAHA